MNLPSEPRHFGPHSSEDLNRGGGERTPEPEEKEPLPVIEEVTPHIIDDFPLGASVSLSVLLWSPPELPHCSSRLSLTI